MKFIVAILALSFMVACKNKDKKQECKDVMCTEFFAMITVEIKAPSGTDMSLFSSKTLRKSDGKVLNEQENPDTSFMNTLRVVDDSHLLTIGYNREIEVVFQLFKDGNLSESYPFVIKTDCCHVEKISGVSVIQAE